MIFIQALLEEKVQVGDKTRLNFVQTFLTPDDHNINNMTVTPEVGAEVYTITQNKYLDYAYETSGTKTITVSATCSHDTYTKTFQIEVVSEADDKLFSNDKDIISHEVDIFRYLRPGRSSFLDFHRIAQKMILDDLDQRGITDADNNKLVAADVFDLEEVSEWSKYLALHLIFKSVQGEVDDVYGIKSQSYWEMAQKQASRSYIRLDVNQDGTEDRRPDMYSGRLVRR